jgi:deoxyhypusine synthase
LHPPGQDLSSWEVEGQRTSSSRPGRPSARFFNIPFEGAERGLQIGTASEKDGSLSGCTFGESVTWGKYRTAEAERLVQIWAEYSVIFPLLASFVLDRCQERQPSDLVSRMKDSRRSLENAL